MLAAVRSRLRAALSSPPSPLQQWRSLCSLRPMSTSSLSEKPGLLELHEVEEILSDVKADDVRVIPVRGLCQWTDFMVLATGRSAWHVRNIAQALIHKVKEKQKGADQLLLPSVEGYEGGKWVVIDSVEPQIENHLRNAEEEEKGKVIDGILKGTVIIHALDEKARAYYNLEKLWTTEKIHKEPKEDIELMPALQE